MIETVVEVVGEIVGGVVIIFLSSASLAKYLLKREDALDELDQMDTKIDIRPYELIVVGSKCAICGQKTTVRNVEGATSDRGIASVPQKCPHPNKCPAKKPHLHVECKSCSSVYFMEPATTIKKKNQ